MAKRGTASSQVKGPWALPDGWRWERLPQAAEICDHLRRPVNNAERLARNEGKAPDELYPYYGATGQAGVIDGYLAEGEYILLGEDGAPFLDPLKAKAYSVSGRFWVNNHAHVLKKSPHLDARLLLHWLNTIKYEPFVNGTTRLKLTQGAMMEMPVPVPPPLIQPQLASRIDELLAEIDDGEAALARARNDLATWRKALLKAAVTGELTAGWRAANPPTKTGADLLDDILSKRRARWDAEPKNRGKQYPQPATPDIGALPGLPAGWCWATMDQLSWASGYGTSEKCSVEHVGTPVLRIPNIRRGVVNLDDLKYTAARLPLDEGRELSVGDLLIVRTNGSDDLIGRAALILTPLPGVTYFASYLIRLRLLGSVEVLRWIAILIDSPVFRASVLRSIASSAGQYNLSLSKIETFAVPIPPLDEIEAVISHLHVARADAADGECSLNAASDIASTLRQSILAAAFRGDLA